MATVEQTVAPDIRGRELAYTTLDSEVRIDSLPVAGSLPKWLTGTLLRTGPAKFEVGGRSLRHVFDGLAMLHSFSFDGERVGYANRFLESRAYRAATERGRIEYQEFATDPCRSIFRRVSSMFSPKVTDNGNVNVTRIGEQFVALTETPMPVAFDPQTLDTLGLAYSPPGSGGRHTSAHPHYDPMRKEALTYQVHFGPRNHYRLFAVRDGRNHRQIASLATKEPSYLHSFGMTERFLVLFLQPLVVNPLHLALSGRPFIENYRWEPDRGTQIAVFDRDTGELAGTWETEPLFVFHHVNAFERDGELVLDLAAFEDAGIIEALYMETLRRDGLDIPAAELRRYTVPLGTGAPVRRETLVPETIELPRINYGRMNGRPYRYAYGVGRREGDGLPEAQLVKADVERHESLTWHEPDCFPGEPVFVEAPDADGEDDGAVLSPVLDGRSGRSFMLVLDAETFTERARAEVPHHIPFHFHGSFFSSVEP
jgi:carotenoid cleavage dioxygenase-like enzyme